MPKRRKKALTDDAIASMPTPRAGKKTYRDTDQRGLYIRVTPKGTKTFWVVLQSPLDKKVKWVSMGDAAIGIDTARVKARTAIKAILEGTDPEGPQSVAAVANRWFERVVQKGRHRAAHYVRAHLDNYIIPAWSGRDFESIHRGDIAKLLDGIEDKAGASAADKILNIVSRICSWYAARHHTYNSPIVRGMRRISTKEQARDRILTDDELRTIWKTAEANGQFGAFIRLLVLTGQRREKVAAMRWQDVDADGIWSVPADDREKGNIGRVKLPQAALAILASINPVSGNLYVFPASRGDGHFSGYSKAKAAFDKKAGINGWVLHDLRRTARSLMSRAGVSSVHAERVLGHAIRGVEGTYDRHRYEQEKGVALERLAGLIALIVNPSAGHVVCIG